MFPIFWELSSRPMATRLLQEVPTTRSVSGICGHCARSTQSQPIPTWSRTSSSLQDHRPRTIPAHGCMWTARLQSQAEVGCIWEVPVLMVRSRSGARTIGSCRKVWLAIQEKSLDLISRTMVGSWAPADMIEHSSCGRLRMPIIRKVILKSCFHTHTAL